MLKMWNEVLDKKLLLVTDLKTKATMLSKFIDKNDNFKKKKFSGQKWQFIKIIIKRIFALIFYFLFINVIYHDC